MIGWRKKHAISSCAIRHADQITNINSLRLSTVSHRNLAKHANIRNILTLNGALISWYSPSSLGCLPVPSRPLEAIDIGPISNGCSGSPSFHLATKPPSPSFERNSKQIVARTSLWLRDSLTHSKRHLPRTLPKVLLDQKKPSSADRKFSTRMQKSKGLTDNLRRPIRNTYLYGTRISSMVLPVFIFDLGTTY